MVPEAVLAAFGASGSVPVPLIGGQGTAWRAGEIVLKPAGPRQAARWTAELYSRLSGPGFRVPRPVRAAARTPVRAAAHDPAGGDWVAEGWVAWQWLPGAPADWSGVSLRWGQLLTVSRAFHAALAGIPAPSWLGRTGTQWTVGDQVAWGERDPGPILESAGERLGRQIRSLLSVLRPVDLPSQLMHGDLGGNVLFAGDEPPAVIDFSPYWRPPGLAIAVAAVDALQWSRADPAILGHLAAEPELDQLLARALVYRHVTEIVARAGGTGLDVVARTGQPVTDLILARIHRQP
ncbi:MAG TPA: phosphotransferase [Streptosporangiaceae bacterium]